MQALSMERGMCKKTSFSEGCNSVVRGKTEIFGPVNAVQDCKTNLFCGEEERNWLLQMPLFVFEKLWPDEMFVLGLRVCKELRGLMLQGKKRATISVRVGDVVACRDGASFENMRGIYRVVSSSAIFCNEQFLHDSEEWNGKELEFNTCSTHRIPWDLLRIGGRGLDVRLSAKLFYTFEVRFVDFNHGKSGVYRNTENVFTNVSEKTKDRKMVEISKAYCRHLDYVCDGLVEGLRVGAMLEKKKKSGDGSGGVTLRSLKVITVIPSLMQF